MIPDLAFPPHETCSLRPGYRGTSLQSFFAKFPTEEACLRHILHCFSDSLSRCKKCDKEARLYPIRGTRRFQYPCGHSIHPLMGTIFSRTNIPLQLWFYAMLHFSNSAEGVNSVFLGRHLGISSKAAFRMAQKIRLQMAALDDREPLGGVGRTIEIRWERIRGIHVPGHRKSQFANVMFMSDGLRVSSCVIGKPRRHILSGMLLSKCEQSSRYITSCYQTYRVSSDCGSRRPILDFIPDFHYDQKQDNISGFQSYFRKPLKFNYRRITQKNLWIYLKEFEFRYNRRLHSERIFWDIISRFPNCSEQSEAHMRAVYMLVPPDERGG